MTTVNPETSERRSGPERTCIVCIDGVYVTKFDSDTGHGVQEPIRGVSWHVEACSNCGHVLFFRRDWKQPDES